MFARLTTKTIWAGICVITGLVLSASSYADYLYKGHYYKNRQDGSVYQVPSRYKNQHRKHRKYRKHRKHRKYKPHRLDHHPDPQVPAHNSLKYSPGTVDGSTFQNNHGKFHGLKGHRVEGSGRPGSNPARPGSNPASRPRVTLGNEPHSGRKSSPPAAPAKHYKKACKSVDDAIWAAQRIYPGGRIISAKPIIDRTGRRTSVEIRIMYRGSVKLINERC